MRTLAKSKAAEGTTLPSHPSVYDEGMWVDLIFCGCQYCHNEKPSNLMNPCIGKHTLNDLPSILRLQIHAKDRIRTKTGQDGSRKRGQVCF